MFSFIILLFIFLFYFFFFNDPATTEIYTLSLHDALPIYDRYQWLAVEVSSFQLHDSPHFTPEIGIVTNLAPDRSEEHTSELQSHSDLVCRLLLEKKKKKTKKNNNNNQENE